MSEVRPVHAHVFLKSGKQRPVLFDGATNMPPVSGNVSFSIDDGAAYLYYEDEWQMINDTWQRTLVEELAEDYFAMFRLKETPFGVTAEFRRWADDEIIQVTSANKSPGVALLMASRHLPVDWSAGDALPF